MTTKILVWVCAGLIAALLGLGAYTKITLNSYKSEVELLESNVKNLTLQRDLWKQSADAMEEWMEKQAEADRVAAAMEAMNDLKVEEIEKAFEGMKDEDSSDVLKSVVDGLSKGAPE